jgi:hypothetical protein
MRAIDELLERAKRLPLDAQRELRDRLEESLEEAAPPAEAGNEGPYAALLQIAGTAHSKYPDVSANKNRHLSEIYAGKRDET